MISELNIQIYVLLPFFAFSLVYLLNFREINSYYVSSTNHSLEATKYLLSDSLPEIQIDKPDLRIEGSLKNHKKYVVIGATLPRKPRQITYTWYIPVTARYWAYKGFLPLVFLAGNFSQWESNILGSTARDELRKIPGVVIVYFTCQVQHEVTLAQVVRIMGVGNMIDVSAAEDSYFITTDLDLWPLNIDRHILPENKQILITRALTDLSKCCSIGVALSCIGAKGKTWREITTFDDCNKNKTSPEYFERYCTEKGVMIHHKFITASKIRTVSNSAEKILDYASEFLGEHVRSSNEGKGFVSHETWFVDQQLATILIRMWNERNVKKGGNARQTTVWYPKKVRRIHGGKHNAAYHKPSFNLSFWQDCHLKGGVEKRMLFERELVPLMKYLLPAAEIDVISEYQKVFESKLPQWYNEYELITNKNRLPY